MKHGRGYKNRPGARQGQGAGTGTGERSPSRGGARAVATLILAAPGAQDALASVRAELDEPGVTGAASALDGRLVLRCLAPDAWPLRRQMLRLIERLSPGATPRCWQT